MHFKEILSLLTGVSVPIFGIQWKPITAEVKVARDLLRELEDKRVLYRPYDMEGGHYCIHSVVDMRQTLTSSLQQVDSNSHLYKQLQKIRRACREFCDVVGSPKYDSAAFPVQESLLARELSRLRNTVGAAVGAVALAYGLDVKDELASIIPFNNLP